MQDQKLLAKTYKNRLYWSLIIIKIIETILIFTSLSFSQPQILAHTIFNVLFATILIIRQLIRTFKIYLDIASETLLICQILNFSFLAFVNIIFFFKFTGFKKIAEKKTNFSNRKNLIVGIKDNIQLLILLLGIIYLNFNDAISLQILQALMIVQIIFIQILMNMIVQRKKKWTFVNLNTPQVQQRSQKIITGDIFDITYSKKQILYPDQEKHFDKQKNKIDFYSLDQIIQKLPIAILLFDLAFERVVYSNEKVLSIFNCQENQILESLQNCIEMQNNLIDTNRCKSISLQSQTNYFWQKSKQQISSDQIISKNNLDSGQFQIKNLQQFLGQKGQKFRIKIKTQDKNNKPITKLYHIKKEQIMINDEAQTFLMIRNVNKKQRLEEITVRKENDSFLLNSFTHELKTPINFSLQYIEQLLEKTKQDISLQDILLQTKNSIRLLSNQLNDILDFAAIQLDDFEYQYSSFSVKQLISDIKNIFQPAVIEKNINFDYHITPSEIRIYNDEKRITQILINLMNNSIKYTKENGKIRIYFEQISDCKYQFRVWDNGIGIQKQRLQSIKKTLFSQQNEIDLDVCYVGIGFQVCNQLVKGLVQKAEQNSLKIESEFLEWTEISFVLQDFTQFYSIVSLEDIDDEILLKTPSQQMFNLNLISYEVKSLSFQKNCSYPTILIVDDVPFNQIAFNSTLKQLNFKSDKAYDGVDALQKVQNRIKQKKCDHTQCQTFKIIFMDIDMPIMDGITATREINQLVKSNNLSTNIIICSAFDGKDIVNSALNAGAVDYLTKPIERKNLLRLLAQYHK